MGARVIKEVNLTTLANNSPATAAATERSWRASPQAARRTCRLRSPGEDRLDRRHGRQRHGEDKRRDRGCRVDLQQPLAVQHPRCQLLAALDDAEQLHEGPARPGRREAVLSNVVVVVAAGNYGKPVGPSGVPFAPGNDPFVITVGAIDLGGLTVAAKHEVPSRPTAPRWTGSASRRSRLLGATSSARCRGTRR